MARSDVHPVTPDADMLKQVTKTQQKHRRWNAVEIRLRSVTVLVVEGYFITANFEILHQLFLLIKHTGLPTILAADWQAEPGEVAGAGWPELAGLQLVVPTSMEATSSSGRGRLLEFFAVSKELIAAVQGCSAMHPKVGECTSIDTVPWGPHSAFKLILHARPRQVMCHKLKAPRPLPLDKYGGGFDEKHWEAV